MLHRRSNPRYRVTELLRRGVVAELLFVVLSPFDPVELLVEPEGAVVSDFLVTSTSLHTLSY